MDAPSEEPTFHWHSLPTCVLGGAVYTAVGLCALASCAVACMRPFPTRKASTVLYHVFLLALGACRAAWFAATDPREEMGPVIAANRAGFCFSFTTYSLVIYFWAEQFAGHLVGGARWLAYIRYALVAANALIFCLLILIFELWWNLTDRDQDNGLGVAATCMVVVTSVVLQTAVMMFAGLLWWKQRHAWWSTTSQGHESRKLVVTATVFCACCWLRIVVFAYGARIMDESEVLFFLLGYWLPEGISTIAQLYIIHTSGEQQQADMRFVEELFKVAKATQPEEDSSEWLMSPGRPRYSYSGAPQ
eukprot:m51a1_g6132 hypothetical protein (304) ;mRNA; r:231985-233312